MRIRSGWSLPLAKRRLLAMLLPAAAVTAAVSVVLATRYGGKLPDETAGAPVTALLPETSTLSSLSNTPAAFSSARPVSSEQSGLYITSSGLPASSGLPSSSAPDEYKPPMNADGYLSALKKVLQKVNAELEEKKAESDKAVAKCKTEINLLKLKKDIEISHLDKDIPGLPQTSSTPEEHDRQVAEIEKEYDGQIAEWQAKKEALDAGWEEFSSERADPAHWLEQVAADTGYSLEEVRKMDAYYADLVRSLLDEA